MSQQLAIIIINWNQAAATQRCLRELADLSLDTEIWVVDNASEDIVPGRFLRDFPEIRLLVNRRNEGFGAANNRALREVAAPFALLLNNDAFVPEDAISLMVKTMEEHPQLAVLGPVLSAGPESDEVVSLGGRDVARHIRTHLRPGDFPEGELSQGGPVLVDYVPGAVVFVRTDVIRELGYLEEEYFFGGELADFCELLRAKGYDAGILPSARGWHDMADGSGLRKRLYPYYILRNRFLFVRRHRRRLLLPFAALWAGYGLAVAARALVTGDATRARLSFLAVKDGLQGRFGNQNDRVLG